MHDTGCQTPVALTIGLVRCCVQTWKKMGAKGQAAALALPLRPEEAALVGKALEGQ